MPRASLRLATLGLLAVAAGVSFGQTSVNPGILRLKSGAHVASATQSGAISANAFGENAHFVAVFATVPTSKQSDALTALGYRVLLFVPDTGLLVYGDPTMDLSLIGVQENYPLQTRDKLSAALNTTSDNVSAVVEFYADADVNLVEWKLLDAGIELIYNPDLKPTQRLVKTTAAKLARIAAWDETYYVFPASQALLAGQHVESCGFVTSPTAGVTVAANLVQTFGDGWAGTSHGAAAINYLVLTSKTAVSVSEFQAAVTRMLTEWSANAQITFTPVTSGGGARTIEISFQSGNHGDGYPFARSGAVLAHTFYPPPNPEPIAGDMHINYDEAWTSNGTLKLYPVMLHELGHALGLGHADDPTAVMYPYYQGLEKLTAIDIAALQTLYAKPVTNTGGGTNNSGGGTNSGGTDNGGTDNGGGSGSTPNTPTNPTNPTNPTDPTPTNPTTPTKPTVDPSADRTAPVVTLFSPTRLALSTYSSTLTVQGFASDNVGVTAITWSTSNGASGTTKVASPFSISAIPLVNGVNRVVIAATDAAGNVGAVTLTVTKR